MGTLAVVIEDKEKYHVPMTPPTGSEPVPEALIKLHGRGVRDRHSL
jgi:hypothetical protein